MDSIDWVVLTFFGVPFICLALDYWLKVSKELAGYAARLLALPRKSQHRPAQPPLPATALVRIDDAGRAATGSSSADVRFVQQRPTRATATRGVGLPDDTRFLAASRTALSIVELLGNMPETPKAKHVAILTVLLTELLESNRPVVFRSGG